MTNNNLNISGILKSINKILKTYSSGRYEFIYKNSPEFLRRILNSQISSLLGVVFVSGFGLAWLVFGNMHMRSQLRIHRLKKQLNKQSKQVAADTKA